MTILGHDLAASDSDFGEPLQVRVSSLLRVQRIELYGELDLATVHQVADAMRRVAAGDGEHVEVCLAGLQFIGACGVTALVSGCELVTGRGKSFTVVSTSPISRRVLQLTGAAPIFGLDAVNETE